MRKDSMKKFMGKIIALVMALVTMFSGMSAFMGSGEVFAAKKKVPLKKITLNKTSVVI